MPRLPQRFNRSRPFSELLEQVHALQPAALRTVFDWLSPSVAGYLRVRGASDPEGLTNEVFLRVFRRIGSFSGNQSKFRSWVFAIAHNLLIDEHRKQQRRVDVVELNASHDSPSFAAEQEVLERLGLAEAARLLSALTPDQRTVLYLRIVAGLSVVEAAAVMDRDVGAVKALQHRGIAALRRRHDVPSEISSHHP